MRAVGRLGQAADVLAHGVAPDPEPPGDLPQGEALDPTKVLTWRPYSPARPISSSGRIRPSPFSRAVAVVRARSRESATSCWVSPRAHPAPSPICSRKGYSQTFRRPGGRFAAAIANTSGWGTTSNCWRTPRRGRAVNQRRRSGTCRYRTPHTPPEARGGRFSWSRCQGRRQNIPVGRSKSVPPERSLASVNVRASCSGEVSQRQAGSRLGG